MERIDRLPQEAVRIVQAKKLHSPVSKGRQCQHQAWRRTRSSDSAKRPMAGEQRSSTFSDSATQASAAAARMLSLPWAGC